MTVTIIVLFSVVNFRMRPGEEKLDGPPIHGNTRLEVIWTAIPAIILVVLCSYSWIVLNDIEEAQANEMRVNVTGQQFAWTFEYPQAGGKPIKSTQLYLPKDRPVRFYVKALDVIHDFWVPAFRMKVDAVPGHRDEVPRHAQPPGHVSRRLRRAVRARPLGHALDGARRDARRLRQVDRRAEGARRRPPAAAPPRRPTARRSSPTATARRPRAAPATRSPTPARAPRRGPIWTRRCRTRTPRTSRSRSSEPDAEIAAGFQAGIMPKNYGDTLSAEELEALVKYLGEVAGK